MSVKITVVGSDNGQVFRVDTIEHEGSLWLVPKWVEVLDPAGQEPARAIRLTGLPYQTAQIAGVDFYLQTPIPRGVLNGETPPEQAIGFVVVDRPADNRLASLRPQ